MVQQQGYNGHRPAVGQLAFEGSRAHVYQFQWRRVQKDPYAALASLCQKYRG